MRAIWSGTLSFGLLNIPVRLFSAAKERALTFHLFDKKDHCPISYQKVCRTDNHPVDSKDIVKGYEYEKNQFVILDPGDFKKANVKKTGSIELINFTDETAIEARFYEKPYFLAPEERSAKAYILLRDAIKNSKKSGIGRYVMKDREHIGLIRAEGDFLLLIQLRFADELRDPTDLKIPASAKYSQKELDMATSLVESLSEPFDPSKFKDTYTEELMRVIEAKAKGRKIEKIGREPAATPTDMASMLKVLEQSLKAATK